jgi:hypothetical protein
MTQVFADGDQVADPGMLTHAVHIPLQPARHRAPAPPSAPGLPTLGPSMTPGKGVRRIRCVGCRHETLPRNDDGAPLCQRCSELLASAEVGMGPMGTSAMNFRAPRWLRRRSTHY